MMRKISINACFLILLFCISSMNGWAVPVDSVKAVQAARNFFAGQPGLRSSTNPEAKIVRMEISSRTGNPNYYIITNQTGEGWIILSGDDRISPVIGYSDKGTFVEGSNPAFEWWMQGMSLDMDKLLENPVYSVRQSWTTLLSEPVQRPSLKSASEDGYTDGTPLMSSTWSQGTYYNAHTPVPGSAANATPTGCVATAMGQILKYWGKENNITTLEGKGYYEYKPTKYPARGCDFSSRVYNLRDMPDKLTANNDAVAQLMADCGIAVNMNYDVSANGGSGTVNSYIASGLYNHFRFKKAIYLKRSDTGITSEIWANKVKDEIQNRRPIVYGGVSSGGGHSFIIDGYRSSDATFHFNWGWGGQYDGWYVLTLDGSTPTQPYNLQFSQSQDATFGIEPYAQGETPDFEVTDVKVSVEANDVTGCEVINKFSKSKTLKVKFRVKNHTSNNIEGFYKNGQVNQIIFFVNVPYVTETAIGQNTIGYKFLETVYIPANADKEYEVICPITGSSGFKGTSDLAAISNNLFISIALEGQNNNFRFNIARNERLIEYTENPLCEDSGIDSQIASGGITVYPNPAREFIKVEGLLPDEQGLKIYTITGSLVYVLSETPEQTYNISRLPAGVYFLKKGSESIKFIKK